MQEQLAASSSSSSNSYAYITILINIWERVSIHMATTTTTRESRRCSSTWKPRSLGWVRRRKSLVNRLEPWLRHRDSICECLHTYLESKDKWTNQRNVKRTFEMGMESSVQAESLNSLMLNLWTFRSSPNLNQIAREKRSAHDNRKLNWAELVLLLF